MKKKDMILAIAALLTAAAGMLFVRFWGSDTTGAIRITVDGEEYGTWSLASWQEIVVDTEYGHNVVVIENGEAYMAEADCPDGYCMQYAHIRSGSQSIICLPHRLVVEVVGEDADSTEDAAVPDAVAN